MSECPTCGAKSRVRRYPESGNSLTAFTYLGCTDKWHPLFLDLDDYSALTMAVAELIAQMKNPDAAAAAVIESLSSVKGRRNG